jgi:hypothetical protein
VNHVDAKQNHGASKQEEQDIGKEGDTNVQHVAPDGQH